MNLILPKRLHLTNKLVYRSAILAIALVFALIATPSIAEVLHTCSQDELSGASYLRDMQCGIINVPENPNEPKGKQIALNIMRAPALSATPAKDPVLILAGGPGQAATELELTLLPMLLELNRDRDIVFIDQRGTGKSNPLDCKIDDPNTHTLSHSEIAEFQAKAIAQCFQDYDADIKYYLTPYAIDDFYFAMQELGYDEINLWGSSYGTRAALVFMRRYPDYIRSAVLDAVAPLDLVLTEFMAEDADAALKALFNACREQAQCRQRYPDMEEKLIGLVLELNQSPKQVELVHPLSQELLTVQLSGQLLSQYIRLALYSREVSSVLLFIIDSILREDYRPLSSLIALGAQSDQLISAGLHYTILCATDVNVDHSKIGMTKREEAGNRILQLDPRESYRAVCEKLPQVTVPEEYFRASQYNQPTLLLSGEFDPVTPARWGEQAKTNLANAQHIVVPGAHHGASTLGCLPKLINTFYQAPEHVLTKTDCVSSIKALQPFISPAGPAMRSERSVIKEVADD